MELGGGGEYRYSSVEENVNQREGVRSAVTIFCRCAVSLPPSFPLFLLFNFCHTIGGGGTPPSAATPLYVMMKKENDITPHVNKCPRNMWNEISTWKTVRKKIMLNFYVLGLQKSAIFSMWCNVTFLFCAKSTKMHFGCFMHKSTENQKNVDCTFYFLQCSDSYCLQ